MKLRHWVWRRCRCTCQCRQAGGGEGGEHLVKMKIIQMGDILRPELVVGPLTRSGCGVACLESRKLEQSSWKGQVADNS